MLLSRGIRLWRRQPNRGKLSLGPRAIADQLWIFSAPSTGELSPILPKFAKRSFLGGGRSCKQCTSKGIYLTESSLASTSYHGEFPCASLLLRKPIGARGMRKARILLVHPKTVLAVLSVSDNRPDPGNIGRNLLPLGCYRINRALNFAKTQVALW